MPRIYGNFQLATQNELTDKMKITCCTNVPIKMQQLFSQAIDTIFPHIKPQKMTIVFTRKEFSVRFEEECIGMYVRNLIIFDLNKLETKHDYMVIVAFLEEFAHCLFGIDDEKEVGYKVSEIYPKVTFDGEKYLLKGN